MIPNRMRGYFLKFRIKGTDGGKGYKVHSGFFFHQLDENGLPIIKKFLIKIRPQNSMIDMMANESAALLNLNLKNGGTFNHACNTIGKSGFVGIVCNYFKENIDDIVNNQHGNCPDLQLDPHYRLKSKDSNPVEVINAQ